MVTADNIDWSVLRSRIAETPVVSRPKHVKHPNRSPESLERRRVSARERQRKHYWEHRDEERQRQKDWEVDNPERVRAKRKRFYDSHKDDPVWMEARRQKNREYKARKRAERLAGAAAA